MRSFAIAMSIALTGCIATESEPLTLADMQQRAVQEAYRQCLRDVTREAWWRNWDERYMRGEIERICAQHTGRRYIAAPHY